MAALLAALWSGSAHANGRMPGANDVVFDHGDPDHLVARATFGIMQSFDRGASWQWICEQAIDTSGVIADPPTAMLADGTLVLLPPTGGALLSRDRGCSWERAPSPLAEKRGVDLTLDPGDAAHLYALMSTIEEIDAQGYGVYENLLIETRDNGQSWTLVATLPSDFEAETVEVAASDRQRIYVSGTASRNPRLGILQRSEDGGALWARAMHDLPAGTGSLLISAIDPNDADRLWLRVPARGDTIGLLPARLYLSEEKGESFRQIADTRRGMFGFALSPDGTELAFGGPMDGLFVGPSDGSGTFEKMSSLGVRCLRWPRADALYACGTEPRDAFGLGVSRDKGKSFEGLYRMAETCPADCPEGSSFAGVCQEAWGMIGPYVGASGLMCSVEWAPLSDAGVADAGLDAGDAPDASEPAEEDAAAPGEDAAVSADAGEDAGENTTGKDAGCSCGLLGARAGWAGLDLSGVLLGLGLIRRFAYPFRDAKRRTGGGGRASRPGTPPMVKTRDAQAARANGARAMRSALWCALWFGIGLTGCKDEAADEPEKHRHDAGQEDEFVGCPDTLPAFDLDAQTAGSRGRLHVVLREASALPPVRYFNDWTLEVTDADGAPLEDVEVVRARAYMRVHNHYGTPDPRVVQHEDEPALFDFERINLFMRGPWEVQLTLRSESVGEDDVVVDVCVDE